MAPSVERRLAAVLSADVVGYSRLMAADDEATVEALSACRRRIAQHVEAHHGRVVDAPGDALLAEFRSALDAVQAALGIQALRAGGGGPSEPGRMRLRIGISLGDVLVKGQEIYGDGVNTAARLESMCEPGGICISGPVHDQVETKLDLRFEDAGERELKNLPKPVRVWWLRLAAEGAAPEAFAGGDVPGFAGRPAIAVLPLENLSGDPEQEFFADGLTEDLLTRLSLWRHFPVIARNSSFVYKGRPVDVKQVSRELGCRYVVEGSVRRVGERVRISAQLIDSETGHHIWAERYDRQLDDILRAQDEISEAIAAAMHPELAAFEGQRTVRRDPLRLDAWECASRGWWQWHQLTEDHNGEALRWFERAIALEPDFGWAWAGLSMSHYMEGFFGADWSEPQLEEVMRCAERSVALDPRDPWCQFALATAASLRGDRGRMIAAMELAVELNPSLAVAHTFLGEVLVLVDRAEEGLEAMQKAMRLSPRDPMMFEFETGVACAHYVQGRFEQAAAWARRSLRRRGEYTVALRVLACALGQLGQSEQAAEMLSRALKEQAPLSKAEVTLAAAVPRVRELFLEGVRKAGFGA